jgi:tetratricopeptide (TPR) repeat protein
MQKHFLFVAFLLLLLQNSVSSQTIAELYDKDKYTAIVRIAENADTTKAFTPIELYRIGRAYLNTENTEKALTYFQKTLAAGRDSANVHYFMGVCYKEFKENDKAMSAFDKALKRDSTDQYAWVEKGLLYVNQEKMADATKAFETAVAMPYQYDYPYFVMLSLYQMNKNFDKIPDFYAKWEKTLTKSERYAVDAWRVMGSYEKNHTKDYAKALTYFEKVLEKDLLSIKAYEDVMKTLIAQQNWKKVDKVFERLKKAVDEKRLNQDDIKREAAVVEAVPFNDSIDVITVRYFKKPTEFADPIYKSYIVNNITDSTILVLLTEKSLSFSKKKKEELHMLCGWREGSHLNYGGITRNGKIEFIDYRKRIWGILENKFKPVASTTPTGKADD